MNFSIVITTFNGEKWLNNALKSIKRACDFANLAPLEIYVADDRSDKDQYKLFEAARSEYAELNLVFFSNRWKCYGPARGRNIAARQTRSELLFFLDVDDQLNIRFFTIMISAIGKLDWSPGRDSYTVGGCLHYVEEFELGIKPKKTSPKDIGFFYALLFYPIRLSGSWLRIDSSRLEFQEVRNFSGIEDMDFFLRSLQEGKQYFQVQEKLVQYNASIDTLSGNKLNHAIKVCSFLLKKGPLYYVGVIAYVVRHFWRIVRRFSTG